MEDCLRVWLALRSERFKCRVFLVKLECIANCVGSDRCQILLNVFWKRLIWFKEDLDISNNSYSKFMDNAVRVLLCP